MPRSFRLKPEARLPRRRRPHAPRYAGTVLGSVICLLRENPGTARFNRSNCEANPKEFYRGISKGRGRRRQAASGRRVANPSHGPKGHTIHRAYARPRCPPAPSEIAGMPTDSGMFASVEDRSCRERFPSWLSAAFKAASNGELSEISPEGRTPSTVIFRSSALELPLIPRSRAASVSSLVPACMASRRILSIRPSFAFRFGSQIDFHDGARGMEFTDVPPSISPILKLVLGDSGTRTTTKCPIPRPIA